jgi:hypothetical protein
MQCFKFDVHSAKEYYVVSIFIWPDSPFTIDLLTSKSIGVIDSLGCISVLSLMSVKQKVLQDIEWSVFSYVQFYSQPSTFDLKINTGYLITLHGVPVYKVWSLSSKGFSRYWVVSIFICPVWPLTFDPLTSKSIGFIYYLGCISAWSLKSVKQRVLKILSGQYIPMSSLTLDLWPFDLKINRVHLLFRMYQCMKFEVCQTKGSQDIEWSVYSYVQFQAVWPLTFDLKINRVLLLFRIYQCMKFEVCQAKGS